MLHAHRLPAIDAPLTAPRWCRGEDGEPALAVDALEVPDQIQASPFSYIFKPGPGQLLGVSIDVRFRRARLKSVCSVLRRTSTPSEFSSERRAAQFELLKQFEPAGAPQCQGRLDAKTRD